MRYDKINRQIDRTSSELLSLKEKHEKLERQHERLVSVLGGLMHEIRRFSAELSNTAEELNKLTNSGGNFDHRINDLAQTIFYTSGMLSARLGFTDFELNPLIANRQGRVRSGIYKKFDKARYIVTKNARSKNVTITLHGKSVLEISALQAFDLVPFVLLDNAIKFSPNNQEILVNFEEVPNKELEVVISSEGPMLESVETISIFDHGKRGSNAIKSGVPGEGLGLYLAKTLCDMHGIGISADSSNRMNFELNGIKYSTFSVRLHVKQQSG